MQEDPATDPALDVLEQVALLGPLRREMGRCAAPELNAAAASLVWHLTGSGPQRTSDLAAALRVDVSVVSRQAGELVADGHLERLPDPADRRACLLRVTSAGRAALEAALVRVTDRFAPRLQGWAPDDLARLADDLRRLHDDLLGTDPAPRGPLAPAA